MNHNQMLPADLTLSCCEWLDGVTVVHMLQTCRSLHRFLSHASAERLWKLLYLRDFEVASVADLVTTAKKKEAAWRCGYRRRAIIALRRLVPNSSRRLNNASLHPSFSFLERCYSFAVSERGWIVAGTDKGRVLIIDIHSGQTVRAWRVFSTQQWNVHLVVSGNMVMTTCHDKATGIKAWHLDTGERLWKIKFDGDNVSRHFYTCSGNKNEQAQEQLVVAMSSDGESTSIYYAIYNCDDGSLQWRSDGACGCNPYNFFLDMTHSRLYHHNDDKLVCLDLGTKTQVWQRDMSSTTRLCWMDARQDLITVDVAGHLVVLGRLPEEKDKELKLSAKFSPFPKHLCRLVAITDCLMTAAGKDVFWLPIRARKNDKQGPKTSVECYCMTLDSDSRVYSIAANWRYAVCLLMDETFTVVDFAHNV